MRALIAALRSQLADDLTTIFAAAVALAAGVIAGVPL